MAENIPNQTTTSSGEGAGAITIATTQSTSATAATTIGGGNPSESYTVATAATAATTIAAAGPAGTVTFTSDNYSTATCIMTPSNTVYAPMNLGTITFPFTFNPQMINGFNSLGQGMSFSLPQGEIEGSFRFTTNDCVFTKTVVRPATQATAATTLATLATTQATLATTMGTNATAATAATTNATAPTTAPTNATAATTPYMGGSPTGATAATTLATAATTLATAATTLATNATVSPIATTLAPEVAYLNIEDNVEGNINVNENGYGVTFTINTTGVREGTLIDFVFTGNLIMEEDFVRMEYIDGPLQVRVGPSGTAEVKAELTRNIEGHLNETLGIELRTPDEDGNDTGILSHSVTINAHDNGTAATTLATAATTLATAATTLATPATTLATPATTLATAATTNATAATSATTETGGGDPSADYTVGPGWTDATYATAATTLATAATTNATAATSATTDATEATTQSIVSGLLYAQCSVNGQLTPETEVIFDAQEFQDKFGTLNQGTYGEEIQDLYLGNTDTCYSYVNTTPEPANTSLQGGWSLGGCNCVDTTQPTLATVATTNATAATTNATGATTLATVATTSPTLATQATIDDGLGQVEVYQFIDCDEGAGFEPETVQFSLTDWDGATGGVIPDPNTTVFSTLMEKCFRFDSIQMGTGARLNKFEIDGCACGVR